jgi:hypothetical protein
MSDPWSEERSRLVQTVLDALKTYSRLRRAMLPPPASPICATNRPNPHDLKLLQAGLTGWYRFSLLPIPLRG